MIRTSEAVLRGHPDKFCDQIADRILCHAYRRDPEAYGQIEVAVWSDQIFLTGATVTREPLEMDLADIVREVGAEIGYVPGNAIDAERYQVHDHVCRQTRDPREWTRNVNDQSIVIGWAGYDAATRFLSPEHFLVHHLREALETACGPGQALHGQGPDGKLVVVVEETPRQGNKPARWQLQSVLATLQHQAETAFFDFQRAVSGVIQDALRGIAARDPRWNIDPEVTTILVNPNGPFLEGGSNSDNGQTGRKLVMDFYGPRVPIGGGALSGKDLSHIDRAGAYAARRACVAAVAAGAPEAMVRVTYAPGMVEPLDVSWTFPDGGRPAAGVSFAFNRLRELTLAQPSFLPACGGGAHFFDASFPWNQPF
ncbi:MAG: methionine adenosyltransferase domain-containing protein [Verrucomicrobiales bacterium]